VAEVLEHIVQEGAGLVACLRRFVLLALWALQLHLLHHLLDLVHLLPLAAILVVVITTILVVVVVNFDLDLHDVVFIAHLSFRFLLSFRRLGLGLVGRPRLRSRTGGEEVGEQGLVDDRHVHVLQQPAGLLECERLGLDRSGKLHLLGLTACRP
jgi:hypothetical protein